MKQLKVIEPATWTHRDPPAIPVGILETKKNIEIIYTKNGKKYESYTLPIPENRICKPALYRINFHGIAPAEIVRATVIDDPDFPGELNLYFYNPVRIIVSEGDEACYTITFEPLQ